MNKMEKTEIFGSFDVLRDIDPRNNFFTELGGTGISLSKSKEDCNITVSKNVLRLDNVESVQKAMMEGKSVMVYLKISDVPEDRVIKLANSEKCLAYQILGWKSHRNIKSARISDSTVEVNRGYFKAVLPNDEATEDKIVFIPFKYFKINHTSLVEEVWALESLSDDIKKYDTVSIDAEIGNKLIKVGGKEVILKVAPYNSKRGKMMIPILPILDALGYNPTQSLFSKTVRFNIASKRIELKAGRSYYRVNGSKVVYDKHTEFNRVSDELFVEVSTIDLFLVDGITERK